MARRLEDLILRSRAWRGVSKDAAPDEPPQTRLHIPAARSVRVLRRNPLALKTRAWGMPGARCARSPRVRRQRAKGTRVSQVTPESPGIPHAMVLRLISYSPW